MRWLVALIGLLGCSLHLLAGDAVSGRLIKVLPLFMDQQGKTLVSPSLYERDAYQAVLLGKPALRSGLEFAVQWRAKGPKTTPLTLRVEARGGVQGKLPTQVVLEETVTPRGGLFGAWTSLKLTGQKYKEFGEVTAWRVTLWDGQRKLGEEKSFLWEGELALPLPGAPLPGSGTNTVAPTNRPATGAR